MTKRLKIPAPPAHQKTVDGRFRLVKEIGKGATGIVYEGVQLSVDRTVAVKVLNPTYNVREDYKERFQREAKAIARLSHTNCITLYDFGYSDEFQSLYMVMEYVGGSELYEHCVNDTISLHQSVRAGIQIAEAVAHAHGHGILHRDLKPENVLITEDWTAKVLDFGMARIVDELSDTPAQQRLTQQGAVYGTPAYMSPEQCQGNIDVTEATDIYSLGVILYELVEGRLPFRAPKVLDILVQHVREEPPPIRADIPKRLRSLIMSMLAKRPVERPSDAKIVAETLRSILPEIPAEGAERNTIDVSQEIQKSLIENETKGPQTGEGVPRSTMQGVGKSLESRPATDPGETPAVELEHQARVVETMQPMMLQPEARKEIDKALRERRPSDELKSIDEINVSDERPGAVRFGSETYAYEKPQRPKSGWFVLVALLAAALVGVGFVASGQLGARQAETAVPPAEAAIEESAAAEANAESPRTDDAPTEVDIPEEAAALPPALPEPIVADEPPPPPVEKSRRSIAKRKQKRRATPPPAAPSEPAPSPEPEVATEKPAPSPEPKATDDGKEAPASSTKETKSAEKEGDDKLPTVRFTY